MVDPAQVPQALARLNWVYVRDIDDFDAAMRTLPTAVDTEFFYVGFTASISMAPPAAQGRLLADANDRCPDTDLLALARRSIAEVTGRFRLHCCRPSPRIG
jgi:hypothetical protein